MIRTVLCLVLASSAAAQSLSSGEFEGRRRELRERFARASSVEEKRAVLDEFQKLQLAIGEVAGAGSDEDLALELSGAFGAGGAEVGGTSTTRADAGSGLGAKVQSPLADRLRAFIAATERELSDELDPRYAVLTSSRFSTPDGTPLGKASHDTIEEYLLDKQALREWLAVGKQELARIEKSGKPSGTPSDRDFTEWRDVLVQTGAMRRGIGNYLRQHLTAEITEQRGGLEASNRQLERHRRALEDVTKTVDDVKKAQELTEFVLELKDLAELVDGFAGAIQDPSKITDLVFDQIKGKFDKTSDLIVQGIGNIGQYLVQLELAKHGFTSAEEILRSIQNTLERIRDKETMLAFNLRELQRARRQEDTPIFRPQ